MEMLLTKQLFLGLTCKCVGFVECLRNLLTVCGWLVGDSLSGLVVTIPGYRSRGPVFDSRLCQIFNEISNLERGPLSLARIIEELLERKSNSSGLENGE
jgi:hypothetical protein